MAPSSQLPYAPHGAIRPVLLKLDFIALVRINVLQACRELKQWVDIKVF